MKKSLIVAIAITLTLSFYQSQCNAATSKKIDPVSVNKTNPADQVKIKEMEIRLNEINQIEKKNLTFLEKRELRKEVRTIKKQMSELSGGVYVSVGALILIILLLIILL